VIVESGAQLGIPTPWNGHFVNIVTRIEQGQAVRGESWLEP
jgi:hypothetical protein